MKMKKKKNMLMLVVCVYDENVKNTIKINERRKNEVYHRIIFKKLNQFE
jgi:hypothetical protein